MSGVIDLGGNIEILQNAGGAPIVSSQWVNSSSAIYYTSGSIGIGTTDPTAQLHTTGSVRFANFGSGAATFDANGNISSVSDENLKDIQGPHELGVAQVMNIVPINYKWKPITGFDTENIYSGFSAQNIEKSLGEGAIGRTKDEKSGKEYLSIQDRAIMATMVNAIKELAKRVSDLEQGKV